MSALPSGIDAGGLDAGVSDDMVGVTVMIDWHLYFVQIYLSTSHSHICISDPKVQLI